MSKGKFLVPWRAADLKTNRNDTRSAFKDLNLNTHIIKARGCAEQGNMYILYYIQSRSNGKIQKHTPR